MAQFDENEEVVEEAQQQWEEKEMKLIPSFSIPLFLLLGHAEAKTRACAARAIAAGLEQFPAAMKSVLDAVVRKYKEIAAIEDEKERAALVNTVVALFYLLEQCAARKVVPREKLFDTLDILFDLGFSHGSSDVRIQAIKAGEKLVEMYGEESTQELLQYLNGRLRAMEKDADTDAEVVPCGRCDR